VTAASFIASLVSSLAWPAVIVAILVIFHRQFGTMLDRLARVRLGAGGADADQPWSQAETAVRQSLAAARPSIAAGPGRQPGGRDGPRWETGSSGPDGPNGPALQALVEDRWQALVGELRDLIARSGGAGAGPLAGAGFDQLMDILLRAGRLDSATVRSLNGLAHLRNVARTSTGLTQKQAQDFGVLADAVSYTMRRPGQPVPGQPVPGQPVPGQHLPGPPAGGPPGGWPAS
jgi:hypothetical protein